MAVDEDHCFVGFDGYEKLLASGVDVVLLATPTHFRPMHLQACVAAGKHIFCEKPVAVDAPGVRSVLATSEEAAQKKGCRWCRALLALPHGRARNDEAGPWTAPSVRILAMQETYNTGTLWKPAAPAEDWTEMEFQMRNWYYFTWLSGDHNVEQHIHSLDKPQWAMHEEPPLRAWGLGGRQVRTEPQFGDIYDHHAVVYEYAGGSADVFVLPPDGRLLERHQRCFHRHQGTARHHQERDRGREPVEIYAARNATCTTRSMWRCSRAFAPASRSTTACTWPAAPCWPFSDAWSPTPGQAITWEKAINSSEQLSPARYAMDAEPPILPDKDGKYPVAMPGVTKIV